jgi:hypothetical protein
MKHIVLLIAMAITCILVAVANVIITRMIGLNIFTLKIWFIIPAGAIGMGMLGASGAILAARYFNIQPTIIDAMLMVVIAAATWLSSIFSTTRRSFSMMAAVLPIWLISPGMLIWF